MKSHFHLAHFNILNYSWPSVCLCCFHLWRRWKLCERNGRVCNKVKGWQCERPHPRLFGIVPCPTVLMAAGFHWKPFRRERTLGTGGQPIPWAHLPQKAVFNNFSSKCVVFFHIWAEFNLFAQPFFLVFVMKNIKTTRMRDRKTKWQLLVESIKFGTITFPVVLHCFLCSPKAPQLEQ